MKKDKQKQKDLFYFIILLLTFFILVLSTTFAYYSVTSSQTEDATKVYSGELSINYIDGNIVNALLYPTSEPTYNDTKPVYKNNFTVSSNGTIDQTLNIYLDIANNEFSGNDLKYAIYDKTDSSNVTKLSSGDIVGNDIVTVLNNAYFPQIGSRDYSLFIWLQETNVNQDINRGKNLTATIIVEAVQIKY